MVAASVRWVGLAVLAGVTHGLSVNTAVTPVEKVIDLMKKLSSDLEAEGKQEAAEYDKFACFCKEQADEKQYNIERSTKKIEKFTAKVNELNADISELNKEIATLVTDIASLSEEVAKLTTHREKEHAKYEVAAADLEGAIGALRSAIESLDESKVAMADADEDAKMNLAQVGHKIMKAIDRWGLADANHLEAVQSLIEISQGQPSYEYRSNDILGVLNSLLSSKFLPQKKNLDEMEFNSAAAFDKRTLGLKNEIKFAEKDKAEKEEVVGSKTEDKEAAAGEKVQEQKDLASDQGFLKEVTQECEEKSKLWDQRSQSRSGELTALGKAVDALQSGASAQYDANEKLTGFVQEPKGKVSFKDAPSFLQIQEHSALSKSEQLKKITSMLTAAALKLNSQVLSAAAVKVMVEQDHFVKVRGLIKDLIDKLDEQAKAEATQKGFCDTEMGKATSARDKAKANIESIAATQEELTSEKNVLAKEIAELSETIAQERKALLEAAELRSQESAENAATVSTAAEGKAAVEMATQVLKEYYGSALLQKSAQPASADREGLTVKDRAPSTFDGEYKGNQDASKGIMGLLQVILSDFDRTITEVKNEEKDADATFGTFKSKTEKGLKTKDGSKKAKETRSATIEDNLIELEDKMEDEKLLLNSAHETLSKLKERCVQGEETYAERVAKRKQEIEALKSALDTLENWQS